GWGEGRDPTIANCKLQIANCKLTRGRLFCFAHDSFHSLFRFRYLYFFPCDDEGVAVAIPGKRLVAMLHLGDYRRSGNSKAGLKSLIDANLLGGRFATKGRDGLN